MALSTKHNNDIVWGSIRLNINSMQLGQVRRYFCVRKYGLQTYLNQPCQNSNACLHESSDTSVVLHIMQNCCLVRFTTDLSSRYLRRHEIWSRSGSELMTVKTPMFSCSYNQFNDRRVNSNCDLSLDVVLIRYKEFHMCVMFD